MLFPSAARCPVARNRREDPAKDLGDFLLPTQLLTLMEDPAKDIGGCILFTQLFLSWISDIGPPPSGRMVDLSTFRLRRRAATVRWSP